MCHEAYFKCTCIFAAIVTTGEKNLSEHMLNENSKAQNVAEGNGKSEFRVGTLVYSKLSLMYLFAWLLWGDFCFTLMEIVVPNVLPLNLKAMGATNTVTSLLLTTIPAFLNLTVCPMISYRSDRMRSRWGRRIPILLIATPPIALFLAAIGYSQEIGGFLHHLLTGVVGTSRIAVTLGFLSFAVIGFQFFNMFTSSVYYYLFNDVVPESHLARFLSLFRVVGALAGVCFNFFVLKYATTHMQAIFLGAGVLYAVAFIAMCLKIKEGDYPPPPPLIGNKTGFVSLCKTYFSECFKHRFYWCFFLSNTFYYAVSCVAAFQILLAVSLGLTLGVIGKIAGVAGIVSSCLLYPAGVISDKYHPLRTMIFALAGILICSISGLILLFVSHPSYQFVLMFWIASTGLGLPFATLYISASLPMCMRLLPKERFGQFASADSMVRSIALMIGGLLAGKYLDFFKAFYHGNDFYYRWIYVWIIVCQAISLFFLLRLYNMWKQLGGDKSYSPPE